MCSQLCFGYLLGSIPFGLVFTFASGAGDVRKIGSGNIGATNVLRTGKKWAAAATLLCDGAKGAAAVLLGAPFLPTGCEIFAALAAVLGHIFPVWLKFKGGKGVATFLGVCLALYWPVGLLVAATWLGAAFIWRISSLSALVAIALSPAYFLLLRRDDYALAGAAAGGAHLITCTAKISAGCCAATNRASAERNSECSLSDSERAPG